MIPIIDEGKATRHDMLKKMLDLNKWDVRLLSSGNVPMSTQEQHKT